MFLKSSELVRVGIGARHSRADILLQILHQESLYMLARLRPACTTVETKIIGAKTQNSYVRTSSRASFCWGPTNEETPVIVWIMEWEQCGQILA